MLPTRNSVSEKAPAKDLAENYHVVIWVDHDEARVIHFNAEEFDVEILRPGRPAHGFGDATGGRPIAPAAAEPEFFHEVAAACSDTAAVLLGGSATAKTEFVKYLHRYSPRTAQRISQSETLIRTTDHHLLVEGRRFFNIAEPSSPQS